MPSLVDESKTTCIPLPINWLQVRMYFRRILGAPVTLAGGKQACTAWVLRYLYAPDCTFCSACSKSPHCLICLSSNFYRAIFCDDTDIVAHHVDDHCEFCTLFGAFPECCIRGRIVDLSMRAFNRQRLDVTFCRNVQKEFGRITQ